MSDSARRIRWREIRVAHVCSCDKCVVLSRQAACVVLAAGREQFNAFGDAAPDVEMPTLIALPARRQ